METKQLSSHQFPGLYESLGVSVPDLGCVMLDLRLQDGDGARFALSHADDLHFSPNPARKWVDGYVADKSPHVTLLYGLLDKTSEIAPQIGQVLAGWDLPAVEVASIGTFPSPYPDEEYTCVVAHLEVSPELLEGRQRLELLPHVSTFAGYRPHVTLAYVRPEAAQRFVDAHQHLVGKKIKPSGINLGGNL